MNYNSYGKDNDQQLLDRLKANEGGVFQELVSKYSPALLGFAANYLPDRSEREEVIQEVFIELFVKREKIVIHSSLNAYLIAFTRNKVLNHIRRQTIYKKHMSAAGRNHFSIANCIEDAIDFKDAQDRIRRVLKEMPVKYRQVFELSKECQLTIQKTANILQRPVPTVEKQLRKALSIIKAELEASN